MTGIIGTAGRLLLATESDSPYKSAADLNGKTVGIAGINTMQQVAVMSWVDHHGGDSKSIKFVEVPFPQMCSAVESGRIDAGATVEPFITTCSSAVRSLGNVLDGIAPKFIAIAYAASNSWLAANPELAKKFVSALNKANAWGNAHPKESAAILVRYSKLDPAVANSMARAVLATSLDPALLQPGIDASVKYGAMEQSVPAAHMIWNGREPLRRRFAYGRRDNFRCVEATIDRLIFECCVNYGLESRVEIASRERIAPAPLNRLDVDAGPGGDERRHFI